MAEYRVNVDGGIYDYETGNLIWNGKDSGWVRDLLNERDRLLEQSALLAEFVKEYEAMMSRTDTVIADVIDRDLGQTALDARRSLDS